MRVAENGISDMHFVMKMSSLLGESVIFRSRGLQAILPLPFKAPSCNDDTVDDIHIVNGFLSKINTKTSTSYCIKHLFYSSLFIEGVQNCILAGH